jgi:hypothetical protein
MPTSLIPLSSLELLPPQDMRLEVWYFAFGFGLPSAPQRPCLLLNLSGSVTVSLRRCQGSPRLRLPIDSERAIVALRAQPTAPTAIAHAMRE